MWFIRLTLAIGIFFIVTVFACILGVERMWNKLNNKIRGNK